MGEETKAVYRFGPFLLSPAERSLLKDDGRVPLTPRAFDLLVLLVANSGHLLTKEELMNRLWPDSFVEEANLTQNISTLRRALGDGHGIETVPKLGYRFNTPVRELPFVNEQIVIEEHTESTLTLETQEGVAFTSHHLVRRAAFLLRQHKVVTAGTALLLFIAAGYFGFTRRGLDSRGISLSTTRIERWENEVGETNDGCSFSHAGNLIAFSMRKDGRQHIWVKQLIPDQSTQARQVTSGTWNDWTPVWSPSDDKMAFISNRDGRIAIWLTPSFSGGSDQYLVTIDTGGRRPFLKFWSRDGERIYFELSSNLYVVERNSLKITKLTEFKWSCRDLCVSRDEKLVAYVDNTDGQSDIWVSPLGGGAPTRVTFDRAAESSLVWQPNGKRIIYSAEQDGTYDLREAYLDGSVPRQFMPSPSRETVLDVSAGGSVCFYTTEEKSSLWELNIDDSGEFEISAGTGVILWPQVSPSQPTVAFLSADERDKLVESSILVAPIKYEGHYDQVARNGFAVNWSPDGSRLGFVRYRNGSFDIWGVNAFGNDERQITREGIRVGGYQALPCDKLQVVEFSWSTNGKRLAFCSDKDGAQNIWTVGEDGSGEQKVSNNSDAKTQLFCPLFSPVDDRIAFSSSDGTGKEERYRVFISDGLQSRPVYASKWIMRLLGWSRDGRSLLVAQVEGKEIYAAGALAVDVIEIHPDAGPVRIARLDSVYLTSIRLSPEGRRIAFVKEEGKRNVIGVLTIPDRRLKALNYPTEPRSYFSGVAWSMDERAIFCTKQNIQTVVYTVDGLK